MDKWMFYWLAWLLWIIVYFFDRNEKRRYVNALLVLFLIISSNSYVHLFGLSIYVPIIFLLSLGIVYFCLEKKNIFTVLFTISLSFGYGGIQIWEHFNPLWLFVPTSVIWAIFGYLLIVLFTGPSMNDRIGIWLISTSMGQILYGLVRNSYGFIEPIGNIEFLVDITLLIVVVTITKKLKYLSNKIEQYIQQIKLNSLK